MCSMSIRGLASGLDVDNIIEELISIEQRPIQQMEMEKDRYQQRIEAWRDVNTRLYNLRQAGTVLKEQDFAPLRSRSTNPSVAEASVEAEAEEGVYRLEVEQLAQRHRIASGYVEDRNEALGYSGTLLINGVEVEIQANDSLATIRDAFNTASGPSLTFAEVQPGLEVAAREDNVELILQEGAETGVSVQEEGGGYTVTITFADGATVEEIAQAVAEHTDAQELLSLRVQDGAEKVVETSLELPDPGEIQEAGVRASIMNNRLILESTTSGTPGTLQLSDHNNILENLYMINPHVTLEGTDDLLQARPAQEGVVLHIEEGGAEGEIDINVDNGTITITAGDGVTVAEIYDALKDDEDAMELLTDLSLKDEDEAAYTLVTEGSTTLGYGGFAYEIQEPQDAIFRLDGLEMEFSSNRVEDILEGVTLNLQEEGATWIEIERDQEGVLENVRGFVEQFNSTYQFIAEKMDKENILQGDASLMRIQSDVRRMFMDTVGLNANNDLHNVGSLGFNIDWETNLMELDEGKFLAALREKPEQVQALFQGEEIYETVVSGDGQIGLRAKALGHEVRLGLRQVSPGEEAGVEVIQRPGGAYRVMVMYEAGATVSDIQSLIAGHEPDAEAGEAMRARDLLQLDVQNSTMLVSDTAVQLRGEGFQGVSRRLDSYLERIMRHGQGTISLRQNYYETMMNNLDDRMERVAQRVERTRERLVREFTRLETALQEIMSQGEWLAGQLRSLEAGRRD